MIKEDWSLSHLHQPPCAAVNHRFRENKLTWVVSVLLSRTHSPSLALHDSKAFYPLFTPTFSFLLLFESVMQSNATFSLVHYTIENVLHQQYLEHSICE